MTMKKRFLVTDASLSKWIEGLPKVKPTTTDKESA